MTFANKYKASACWLFIGSSFTGCFFFFFSVSFHRLLLSCCLLALSHFSTAWAKTRTRVMEIHYYDFNTIHLNVRMHAQLHPTLCNPIDCSHQALLSMGFPKQEYWSGLLFPSPGDLPDAGTELVSLMSPALAGRFFTTRATWEIPCIWIDTKYNK